MIAVAFSSHSYTPSADSYLLGLTQYLPLLLKDKPSNISSAPTTPATTIKPTLEQMKYYNYYATSMYATYELIELSCEYCQKFKDDVDLHTGKLPTKTSILNYVQ